MLFSYKCQMAEQYRDKVKDITLAAQDFVLFNGRNIAIAALNISSQKISVQAYRALHDHQMMQAFLLIGFVLLVLSLGFLYDWSFKRILGDSSVAFHLFSLLPTEEVTRLRQQMARTQFEVRRLSYIHDSNEESSDDEDGKEPGEPERQEKEKRAKVGFVEDAAPAVIHDVTEQDGEGSQGLAAMRDMDPQGTSEQPPSSAAALNKEANKTKISWLVFVLFVQFIISAASVSCLGVVPSMLSCVLSGH
jgi:hypothetical protein